MPRDFIPDPKRTNGAGAEAVTRFTPWDELPDVMPLEMAYRKLGIGRTLAYRQAQAGTFPGILRSGNKWLVSKPALMRAAKQEEKPVAQPAGEVIELPRHWFQRAS